MADSNSGTISTPLYQALSKEIRAPLIRKAAEQAVKKRTIYLDESSVASLFGRENQVWQVRLSGIPYRFVNRHEAYKFLADVFQYLASHPDLLLRKKS